MVFCIKKELPAGKVHNLTDSLAADNEENTAYNSVGAHFKYVYIQPDTVENADLPSTISTLRDCIFFRYTNGSKKTYLSKTNKNGKYFKKISEIQKIQDELEALTGVKQILTGDKIWEVLVAVILNHTVFSEQKKHDAQDDAKNLYEYKISKGHSWNFQDISDAVLKKYEDDEAIILASEDKQRFEIKEIYSAKPHNTIPRLKEKLDARKRKLEVGKTLRRLSVSLSKGDLEKIKAVKIFPR